MTTTISIRQDRTIGDVQRDFAQAYPFLKIDFYKINGKAKYTTAEKLDKLVLMRSCNLLREGELIVGDIMTVLELERSFRENFGLYVQVSRKSGTLWLETTMTDNWTLKQQNDHGRELSEPLPKVEDEIDYS
ncbi:MAG TPA: hypothetical protein VHM26_05515 [Chitinophagaceae bacterium]|jgi:hypothetical protein|nr:hypothetical protein [Chitinophagaceae bacterium]